MSKDSEQKWFSTKEAACCLRISPNALRILVHRGRVKSYNLGSRLRFRINDLESSLQQKEISHVSKNLLSR